MDLSIEKMRVRAFRKIVSVLICFTFIFSFILPPQYVAAQMYSGPVLNLPMPGTMVGISQGFIPPLIKGITLDDKNPLLFDFIVDRGQTDLEGAELTREANKLIKYFLAALTVPEEDMWVNLSPYESDRIIPEGFGATEMGRDLLAQDYMLKQLTSSMMYPEDNLGAEFWSRAYQKAYERFGSTDIPMNTFNKIWIVPKNAVIYEHGNSAFVVESQLEVMLEEDFVALQKSLGKSNFGLDSYKEGDAEVMTGVTSDVVREVLIPEIEREVNQGETFAQLRQIYNSMILATWYKINLKESLLGKVYVDRNKTVGVDHVDKGINHKIYEQYLEAFKKGVYNYIKDDYDPVTQQVVPRKYFSGGVATRTRDGAMLSDVIRNNRITVGRPGRRASGQERIVAAHERLRRTMGRGNDNNLRRIQVRLDEASPRAAQLAQGDFIKAPTFTGDAGLGGRRETPQVDEAMMSDPTYMGMDTYNALQRIMSYEHSRATWTTSKMTAFLSKEQIDDLAIKNLLAEQGERVEDLMVEIFDNANLEKNNTTSFGIARSGRRIIIESSFWNEIEQNGNPYNQKTRVLLFALKNGSISDKLQSEFDYIVNKDNETNQLFNGNTAEGIINNLESEFLTKRSSSAVVSFMEEFGPTFSIEWPSQTMIYRDELILEQIVRPAIYSIFQHKLNFGTNRKLQNFRMLPSNRPVSAAARSAEPLTVNLLAFSGNPMTTAHLLTAMVNAMATGKADLAFPVLTEGDYRKMFLYLSAAKRYALTQLANVATGGLLNVMPMIILDQDKKPHFFESVDAFEKNYDQDKLGKPIYLNGEDKLRYISDINRFVKLVLNYGAGADHDFVFSRDKATGNLKFEKIGFDQRLYIEYDFEIYQRFINAILERNAEGKEYLTKDQISFLKEVVKIEIVKDKNRAPETATQQELDDALQEFNKIVDKMTPVRAQVPKLDVRAKLYMYQEKFKKMERDHQVNAIITTRGGELIGQDPYKDKFGIKVIYNEGIPDDISATAIRQAFAKLARENKLDLRALQYIPVSVLKFILANENRDYLWNLVRQNKAEDVFLSDAVDVLFPQNIQENQLKLNALMNELQRKVAAIGEKGNFDNVRFEKKSEPGKNISTIRIFNNANELITAEYVVVSSFNKDPMETLYAEMGALADQAKKDLAGFKTASIPVFTVNEDNRDTMKDLVKNKYPVATRILSADGVLDAFGALTVTQRESVEDLTVELLAAIRSKAGIQTRIDQWTAEQTETGEDTARVRFDVFKAGDIAPELQEAVINYISDLNNVDRSRIFIENDIFVGQRTDAAMLTTAEKFQDAKTIFQAQTNPIVTLSRAQTLIGRVNKGNFIFDGSDSQLLPNAWRTIRENGYDPGIDIRMTTSTNVELKGALTGQEYDEFFNRYFNEDGALKAAAFNKPGFNLWGYRVHREYGPEYYLMEFDTEEDFLFMMARMLREDRKMAEDLFLMLSKPVPAVDAAMLSSMTTQEWRQQGRPVVDTLRPMVEDLQQVVIELEQETTGSSFESTLQQALALNDGIITYLNSFTSEATSDDKLMVRSLVNAARNILSMVTYLQLISGFNDSRKQERINGVKSGLERMSAVFENFENLPKFEMQADANLPFIKLEADQAMTAQTKSQALDTVDRLLRDYASIDRELIEELTALKTVLSTETAGITNLADVASLIRSSLDMMARIANTNGTTNDYTPIRNALISIADNASTATGIAPTANFDQALLAARRQQPLRTIQDFDATTDQNVGGINLDPAMLDLQIKRDDNGVPLPVYDQPIENMNIQGFLPIIINVTPINNLPLLLGIADEEAPFEVGSALPEMPFDRVDSYVFEG